MNASATNYEIDVDNFWKAFYYDDKNTTMWTTHPQDKAGKK